MNLTYGGLHGQIVDHLRNNGERATVVSLARSLSTTNHSVVVHCLDLVEAGLLSDRHFPTVRLRKAGLTWHGDQKPRPRRKTRG